MANTHPFVIRTSITVATQSGVTLLELMLACALGLFLLLSLVEVSAWTKKNYRLENALVTLQENGRFAAHFLSQNIRMAGCKTCQPNPPFTNADLAIQGYQNNVPAFLQGKVLSNTDSVVVGLCRKANNNMQFNSYAFFIGPTTRKNILGNTIYALYEEAQDGEKRELVADVENMQIRYGVATPDGQDIANYLPAMQISDWRSVRALDISLLLNSEEPVFIKPESYSYMGNTMTADRLLHRECEIYIKLRDR